MASSTQPTFSTTSTDRRSRRLTPLDQAAAFWSFSALLFATSVALTTVWSGPMSEMGGMPMPGGWTMSMTWTRMPGQTWPGAAASFLGMWIAMMVAMMMPSLAPALWRYREAARRKGETRPDRLTALVGVGYFLAWTAAGMAVFPAGVALAAVEMHQQALSRAVPVAAGVVVLMAGAFQFTWWKAHHLACCREAPVRGCTLRGTERGTARAHGLGFGLRWGLHCIYGCAGLTVILLVIGMMDLRAMAAITAAITAERVEGERVARAIGAVAVGAGLLLIARTGLW